MGTRRLTLLRHGRAEAADAYPEDYERPLTHRGCIEAQEMASRLVKRNLMPDLILVSPAERAWATAEIIAATCELDRETDAMRARTVFGDARENLAAACASRGIAGAIS